MPRKQVKRTKQKVVWSKPLWLVRSMTFENVVLAVYDNKSLAEAELAKDPTDLYIEESGLNNDYTVVDVED